MRAARGCRHGVGAIRQRPSAGSSSAQGGDREALEELYLLHFDRIYSYLHMSVGNATTRRI